MKSLHILKSVLLVSAIALFAAPHVQADQVLFSDNFDSYNVGGLVGQGGWAAHSGAGSNPIQVTAGGNFAMSGTGEDVNHDLGVTMAAGDEWRMTFDVTVSSFGGGTTYFAHMKDSAFGFNARIFGLSPVAGGDFTFGISEGSASDGAFATDFNFGQTYTVNATYNFDVGTSVLTVDGVTGSVTSSTTDIGQAMEQIAFRQGSGGGDFVIDNASVTAIMAVPEPGSIALLGLGALGLIARRRRS